MSRNSSSPALLETVFATLYKSANPDGVCDMSLRDLSHVTEYSKRSVVRAIKDLVECQVLALEHRKAADGANLRNRYNLNTRKDAA